MALPTMSNQHKMLTKKGILRRLEENREKIREYGIKRIGVFGSYVRDEQKEKSDLDVLIEFERDKVNFDNYMHLKFFIEDLFRCKTDLVILDDLKPRLKPYILKEVEYAKGL